jgi:hypothetical protein
VAAINTLTRSRGGGGSSDCGSGSGSGSGSDLIQKQSEQCARLSLNSDAFLAHLATRLQAGGGGETEIPAICIGVRTHPGRYVIRTQTHTCIHPYMHTC